ncbi:MAG: phosphopyruvate hydratase [Amoebophilaceae bacterium]|nr:phosphopyruvate hydratase [Amoebophilaceae bacterium]
MSKIKDIRARHVLDSRGNPTVEVEVCTQDGAIGIAAVPSGASTGSYEALELRDTDNPQYLGMGVQKAIKHVRDVLKDELMGISVFEQGYLDRLMLVLDGTSNKSRLGANALLGVSLAIAKAAALSAKMPLYRYLGGINANTLPTPMINILNGGVHADNAIDLQEFMIMPVNAVSFSESLRMGVEVFHHLGRLLRANSFTTNMGDEGGFAPSIASNEKAVELVLQAVEKAGYRPGEDIFIALDAAASEFYDPQEKCYSFRGTSGAKYSSAELVKFWEDWLHKYPILSIEDGMAEDDWEGWQQLTAAVGDRVQLVGDDLFVTSVERLQHGIDMKAANAVLIKMNQVGTLSETLETVRLAHKHAYNSIISHRSGETEDTSIADLAVALNTGQIKTGSVSRSDRTAKYNQLLRIEEALGDYGQFAGKPF